MLGSDPRNALTDLFRGIQNTFQNYSRPARKQAWDAVVSSKGKKQIDNIINSPTYKIVGIPKLLKFKEWIEKNP